MTHTFFFLTEMVLRLLVFPTRRPDTQTYTTLLSTTSDPDYNSEKSSPNPAFSSTLTLPLLT